MGGKPVKVLTTDLTEPTAAPAALAAPSADTQTILAGLLADVMHIGEVPVHSQFFADLGADSLVMAHFCPRVRKHNYLRSGSMKDIYPPPTIARLATALTSAVPAQAEQAPAPGQATAEPAAP